MDRKLLVVVDMQNDFIDGALGTTEAQKIVEPVCRKMAEWNGDLFITKDTHEDNYLETAEGKMLPIPHCIRGTDGHRVNSKVSAAYNKFGGFKVVFNKPTFGSVELAKHLAMSDYSEVTFIGLCTDICLLSNAIMARAALPEATIIVDAGCCAGVTPESHNRALDAMKACNITIINDK
ncbi:MAG: cysteine hydrolase [Clostridia bacterium]|nr:cysteine hydrolase [Clostridia bacterium]